MHGVVALTDRGSMIVPVPMATFAELPGELVVSGVPMVRKAELHYTVFNYSLGKLLLQAFDTQPRLRTAIDESAATFDWRFKTSDTYYYLEQDTPGKPELHTVIVMIDAAISKFYREIRELVGEDAAETAELLALHDALMKPPPPHITLYTSDPTGRAGIGLNTVKELDAAIALALTPLPEPGLCAHRLQSELVRGTTPASP